MRDALERSITAPPCAPSVETAFPEDAVDDDEDGEDESESESERKEGEDMEGRDERTGQALLEEIDEERTRGCEGGCRWGTARTSR